MNMTKSCWSTTPGKSPVRRHWGWPGEAAEIPLLKGRASSLVKWGSKLEEGDEPSAQRWFPGSGVTSYGSETHNLLFCELPKKEWSQKRVGCRSRNFGSKGFESKSLAGGCSETGFEMFWFWFWQLNAVSLYLHSFILILYKLLTLECSLASGR